MAEQVDVLIVGAGLSGVAAAYYLQSRLPSKSYAILEARDAIGGTWDLFRYPGVRSDSDMHTLGYSFRPWVNPKAIADGPAILSYVRETAAAYGIDRRIRYRHRATRASWSSADARWRVEVERRPEQPDGDAPDQPVERIEFTCNFLYLCTGYYDYTQGFTPDWPDRERFAGRIIHPQAWPDDLDYTGKRVVVIGSGATAVTLVPAMAERAAHVTMLQRSPTYIVARPSQDAIANWLRRRLPARPAHLLTRWKNIALGMYFFTLARRRPEFVKRNILRMTREQLGPDYDVEKHFSPRYNPWDQRLCLIPDADLFKAINAGKVSIVTDQIERFTATGIRTQSGEELPADIIITATGLNMRLMSGLRLEVDGAPVALGKTLAYRGLMYSGVPNLASSFGYTNASWTLKCELIAQYICRLLSYMDQHGYAQATPRRPVEPIEELPGVNLTSGYVRRALDALPRQGTRAPWKSYQNYALDVWNFRLSPLEDGALVFSPQRAAQPVAAQAGSGSAEA
ncbi:MAG TPA: NAD(P)/FAD-dependent oxidoreductase [Ktedonobacterales bacterium]|nr:NAD(P)/FAD-dependent oxidoreductase [Ktedonobacterales bacterium]